MLPFNFRLDPLRLRGLSRFVRALSNHDRRPTADTGRRSFLPRWRRAIAAMALMTAPLASTHAWAENDNALGEGLMLNIVSLASERLSLARPIAQWKWHYKLPVTDPQGDATLFEGLLKIAPHYGLDPAFAEAFLKDQATASTQAQTAYFDEWRHGSPPPAPDASSFESTRGTTYRVSQSMLTALAQIQPIRAQSNCPIMLSHAVTKWNTQMTSPGSIEKQALTQALEHVCASGGIGGTA